MEREIKRKGPPPPPVGGGAGSAVAAQAEPKADSAVRTARLPVSARALRGCRIGEGQLDKELTPPPPLSRVDVRSCSALLLLLALVRAALLLLAGYCCCSRPPVLGDRIPEWPSDPSSSCFFASTAKNAGSRKYAQQNGTQRKQSQHGRASAKRGS
jgi:hypothetical protein